MEAVRELFRKLKKELKIEERVLLYFVDDEKIPGSYGECNLIEGKYIIKLAKTEFHLLVHILLHELAHVLRWSASCKDYHDDKWARCYGKVYRAFLRINEEKIEKNKLVKLEEFPLVDGHHP